MISATDSGLALLQYLKTQYPKSNVYLKYISDAQISGNPFALGKMLFDNVPSKVGTVYVDFTRGSRERAFDLVGAIRTVFGRHRNDVDVILVYAGQRCQNDSSNCYVVRFLPFFTAPVLAEAWYSLDPKVFDYLDTLRELLEQEKQDAIVSNNKRLLRPLSDGIKAVGFVRSVFTKLYLGITVEQDFGAWGKYVSDLYKAAQNTQSQNLRDVLNTLADLLDDLFEGVSCMLVNARFYKRYGHYGLYLIFVTELLRSILQKTVRPEAIQPPNDKDYLVVSRAIKEWISGDDSDRLAVKSWFSNEELAERILNVLSRTTKPRNILAHGAHPLDDSGETKGRFYDKIRKQVEEIDSMVGEIIRSVRRRTEMGI